MNDRLPPSTRQKYLAATLLALMSVHCGDDSGNSYGNDSGTPQPGGDAGSGTHMDAATSTTSDSGSATARDSATTPPTGDAATSGADAGRAGDAAVADAGGGTDTIPTLNGCAPGDYEDKSSGTATVTFTNFKYMPKCVTIAAGQTVTFSGTFSAHPLEPGTSSAAPTAGSPNNPIVETNTGMSKTFTFPTAGTYPYYCKIHGATQGMVGSIHVK